MACHPNMTLNRDVSTTHIAARLAGPPRERRRRLPQARIFVGFPETQYKRWISAATIGYFLRHTRVSFGGQVERLAAKQKQAPDGTGPNIVLCGDFNSLPEEGVRELLENGAFPCRMVFFFFFTLVTGPRRSLSLTLSDTRVYEPQIWCIPV